MRRRIVLLVTGLLPLLLIGCGSSQQPVNPDEIGAGVANQRTDGDYSSQGQVNPAAAPAGAPP